MLEINKVWNMDCIEGMKLLPDNSVDSIVTDPPYWLSFMGKKWDYDVPTQAIREECLRVLKPWGYLLAFAGTRTQHRMAVRIEDAGFEIRDMIAWVYGSWFPKSLNIGKAVDKFQGNERKEIGANPNFRKNGIENNFTKEGTFATTEGMKVLTKGTSEWEGRWTALKPALEPITVARKPLGEKTVAENCLKWGVGGINIDGCRVEAQKGDKFGGGGLNSPVNGFMGNTENTYKKGTGFRDDTHIGRFPANLIHDGSDEVVDLFPDSKAGKNKLQKWTGDIWSKSSGLPCWQEYWDSWSASRFFYVAKASKSDRNEWCEGLESKFTKTMNDGIWKREHNENESSAYNKNNHPTVKPTDLMRYLTRLVTRKWWLVLDPFTWSWSTWKACKLEWFDFIWFELDEWYCDIANKRL